MGIDGDYVNRERLLIDRTCFRPHDLALPIQLDQMFDLAISLEVAEHLPTRASGSFVESLVRAAPVVLFSAAIPGQGGTRHINEQWPEFWQELFGTFDYQCLDLIRSRIFLEPKVEWWYKQNVLVFMQRSLIAGSRIFREPGATADLQLVPVGRRVIDRYKSVSGLTRELLRGISRSMKNRLARIL